MIDSLKMINSYPNLKQGRECEEYKKEIIGWKKKEQGLLSRKDRHKGQSEKVDTSTFAKSNTQTSSL